MMKQKLKRLFESQAHQVRKRKDIDKSKLIFDGSLVLADFHL